MVRKLFVLATVIAAAVVVYGVLRSARGQSAPCSPQFVTRLQNGIGTLAPPPTSTQTVSPAIINLAYFIQYRSAVSLSTSVEQQLGQLEQSALPGGSNGNARLSLQQVQTLISGTLLTMAEGLTTAQLNSMTASFQSMPCWTPSNRGQEVLVRSNGTISTTAATFVQMGQQLAGSSTEQSAFTSEINSEVAQLCSVLSYAIPAQWNVTTYDPYQVFVLTYALVSEDHLADSFSTCDTYMSNEQSWLSSQGFNCPCSGQTMWGDAGYLYSSPLSTIFSGTVQSNLLNGYASAAGL